MTSLDPKAKRADAHERRQLDRRANRKDLAIALSLLVVVSLLLPLNTSVAATARAGNLTILQKGNDRFWNYDFLSERAQRNNVDWPMTVIFIDNATINSTKSKIEDWGNDFDGNSTNSMHAKVSNDNDSAWQWDGDRGKKTPACPGTLSPGRDWSPHYRVYAPTTSSGRESMYNVHWGYWNIGSTHRDWYECGGNTLFERPEANENYLIAEVDENTLTQSDLHWFNNHEPYREEGNHIWTSNGYASTIRIP